MRDSAGCRKVVSSQAEIGRDDVRDLLAFGTVVHGRDGDFELVAHGFIEACLRSDRTSARLKLNATTKRFCTTQEWQSAQSGAMKTGGSLQIAAIIRWFCFSAYAKLEVPATAARMSIPSSSSSSQARPTPVTLVSGYEITTTRPTATSGTFAVAPLFDCKHHGLPQ